MNSTLPDSPTRPSKLSIAALLIGVIAIALACLPALAFEQSLPDPFSEARSEQPVPKPIDPPVTPTGGLTFKYKNFSVTLGGKAAREEPKAETAPPKAEEASADVQPKELAFTRDPARWFMITAVCTALGGIVVASVGQVREKHSVLTAITIGCCAAAITWQYFAVGIAMGAAAAAFLIVLLILASIFNGV